MAGFTLNGFGASDSYYPLKELKMAHCRVCGRDTQFSLMELKMKIRLLYIPTVSVGTKYAVVCTRCKNGFYVSQDQRDFILNNPVSKVSIDAEGVTLHGIEEEVAVIAPPVEAVPVAEEVEVQASEPEIPAPTEQVVTVPAEQEELDAFFVKEEPKPAPKPVAAADVQAIPVYRPRKVCPSCRMMFPPEKEVCTICGTALQEK